MPSDFLYIGVQPNDNRLVVANAPGSVAGGSPSTVWFSEAGDPETWGADDFVELTPGDGEQVTGLVAFRDYLIVFKRTKFFVFYGNSVDQSGEPVFNYRAVDTGIGLAHPMACATSPEGVYFVADDGVYLTSGGPPIRVSNAIGPVFGVGKLSEYTDIDSFPAPGSDPPRLTYFNRRLYVAYTDSADSPRCWVYDPQIGAWMHWQVPYVDDCANNGLSAVDGVLYLGTHLTAGSGTLNIYSFDPTADDDDGTAVDSHYHTGFYDLDVDVEKRARQMTAWGTGNVNLQMRRDFGALDTARALELGTDPAIDRDTVNCAKDGMLLAHRFSGTTPWTLYRTAIEFMALRPAGAKTP
jgi:hypothetical protein